MTVIVAKPEAAHQTRLGIVLVIAGLSIAAFTGALMKLLSGDLHAIRSPGFVLSGSPSFSLFLWRSGLADRRWLRREKECRWCAD